MKFLAPLTLLVAAGVSAQDKSCEADYIVTQCLFTTDAMLKDCHPADYDCQCAAQQAIVTCYNNCPNDPRAPPARGQVIIFCQNASVYGTKAQAAKTSVSGVTASSTSNSNAAAATTSADPTEIASNAVTSSSSSKPTSTSTGAAHALSGGAGGVFVAVAGVVAALL